MCPDVSTQADCVQFRHTLDVDVDGAVLCVDSSRIAEVVYRGDVRGILLGRCAGMISLASWY